MFDRKLELQLLEAIKFYPIVTLTGPRQLGKTTLVKLTFPNHKYFNLEDLDVLEQIKADPKQFLRKQNNPIIIDEVQNYPELLSYIQVVVDENPVKGRFILTGSHQFSINQSLAGRTDILVLYPLSFAEVKSLSRNFDLDDWLVNGFYPRVLADDIPAVINSKNYIKTYVERDVRKIINCSPVMICCPSYF